MTEPCSCLMSQWASCPLFPRGAPQPCLVCTHARNKCDKCARAATNQSGTAAGRERRAQSCVPRSCLPPST